MSTVIENLLLRKQKLVEQLEKSQSVEERDKIERQLEQIKGRVREISKGKAFSAAAFRDAIGTTRKYAIPLLEFLDRERVTRRQGDVRVIL